MLQARYLSDDPARNLQLALGIELSVLPPYLYALWSIKTPEEGASWAATVAATSIRAVAYQEMLHAALVGNLLNALGTQPRVTANLMRYPGPLPGHVTQGPYAFDVGLRSLSASTIAMFKAIERPEWDTSGEEVTDWITIGAFYAAVTGQLRALPDGSFGGGHQLPEGDNPGPGRLVNVDNLTTALEAIATIVEQGEGLAPPDPNKPQNESDGDHEVAHFYQFCAIGEYFADGSIDTGRDVHAVIDNPRVDTYTPEQRALNERFNMAYTELLDGLTAMFSSSDPRVFGTPTKLMGELSHVAALLREAGPVPDTDRFAGPTFDYLG